MTAKAPRPEQTPTPEGVEISKGNGEVLISASTLDPLTIIAGPYNIDNIKATDAVVRLPVTDNIIHIRAKGPITFIGEATLLQIETEGDSPVTVTNLPPAETGDPRADALLNQPFRISHLEITTRGPIRLSNLRIGALHINLPQGAIPDVDFFNTTITRGIITIKPDQ